MTESEQINAEVFNPNDTRLTISQILYTDNLTPNERILLTILEVSIKMDDETICIPDDVVTDCMGCEQRAFIRARDKLIEKGIITVEEQEQSIYPHYTIHRDQYTDEYRVPGCVEAYPEVEDHNGSESNMEGES